MSERMDSNIAELEKAAIGGAKWFYWIAGLSLVNSAIFTFGGDVSFIVGLGITQVFDAIGAGLSEQIGKAGTIIAVVFNIIVAGIFALFGVFALKRHTWAFIVGMVIYAFDGLIFLLVQDWLSIGFHVFALYWIFKGCKANASLLKMPESTAVEANDDEIVSM